MDRLFKKLISGLLVVALLFSSVPLSGFAGMDWASLFPQKARAVDSTASDFDVIEFGYYPQTRVTDALTISALSKLKKSWKSYGYYSGTGNTSNGNMTSKNYMRYTDVIYKGGKYRGVVFDSYRPYYTGFTSDKSKQADYGYATNTVYWFKYEPIKWRVIDPDEGLVLSDVVLDSQPFNNYLHSSGWALTPFTMKCWGNSAQNYYANNYERSSLRQWLNSEFYGTAFSATQRNLIQYSEIENHAYSSRYSPFDSDTTTDKIFLLSYDDAMNPNYGFSSSSSESETRMAAGSDYAKCQGLWKNDDYPSYAPWRLRTAGERGDYVCLVSSVGGYIRTDDGATDTSDGIRPVMRLDLSALENVGNGPGSITVTFPAGNDVNPYAGLVVKATGLTNGKVFSRFVSNSNSMCLLGLEEAQNYRVELVSQSGVVFGSAENVVLDEQYCADITFSNLKPRLTAELTVKDPSGHVLTEGYTTQWMLTDSGKLLGSGNTVSDVTTGTALSYEIRLTEALEAEYLVPAKQDVTLDADGTIECTLQKLTQVTVNGTVEKENGSPLSGASVCIEQKINDRISDSTVALTDNNGAFTAEIIDAPLTVTVSKKGYRALKWTGTADQIDGFTLLELTGERVSLDLTKTAIGADPQAMLYDEMDLIFSATVNGDAVDDVVYDYSDLVFPDGSLANGATVVIAAQERSGAYVSAPVTFTYDETETDSVALELIEKGHVSAQADDSANDENMLLLYDGSGSFVTSAFSSSSTIESEPLDEGTYTAVVLGKSDILASLPSPSLLEGYGLTADEDYYTASVTVQNGSEAVLSGFSIPHLDETSLYQTESSQTNFRINPSSCSVGQNLLVRCAYGFSADKDVSNATVTITLPDQCSLVLNSLTVNGYSTASYEKSGNTLTVPTIDSSGVVRLYVRPTSTNDGKPLSFAASLTCKLDGNQYRQPIGTAQAVVKDVDWWLPRASISEQVAVSGRTVASAKIELYDNDVLAGTETADNVGRFAFKFDLVKPYSYSIHNVHIVITLPDGDSYQTAKKQIVYNAEGIALKKITMLNTGDRGPNVTVFDFLNPSTSIPNYRIWPGRYPTFTFKVEFTDNDPESISNVYVITTNNSGQKTYIPVSYNESLGYWIGTHNFSNGNDAPAAVNATYEDSRTARKKIDTVSGESVASVSEVADHSYHKDAAPAAQSGDTFHIDSLAPNQGSNGTVTIKITGSCLNATLTASLKNNKTTIKARQIYSINAATAYATFDLSGAEDGKYELVVKCNGETSSLPNAFTLNSELPKGELSAEVRIAETVQAGETYNGSVILTNTGYTDVDAPLLYISGSSLSVGETTETMAGKLLFYAASDNGLGGTLLAEEYTGYNFCYRAENTGDFSLTLYDAGKMDYLIFDRPALTASSSPAEILSDNWVSLMGQKSGDYAKRLSGMANYLSQFGADKLVLDTLKNAWYNSANASLLGETLLSAADLSSIDLELSRSYLTGITKRSVVGMFGKGWASDYEITAKQETVEDENYIIVSTPTAEQAFKEENGQYVETVFGLATAEINDDIVTVTNRDGSTMTFTVDGKLSAVCDNCGNGVNFSYTNGLLTGVASTNGDSITLNYLDGKVIRAVSSVTGDEVTYTYSDDFLSSVTTKYGTTGYTYDTASIGGKRNALTAVSYPDGSRYSFEYDKLGRLVKQYGNGNAEAVTYAYGKFGDVTVTDALGNKTQLYYNEYGLTARTVSAAGGTVDYRYTDKLQTKKTVYNARLTYTYEYNDRYDMVIMTDPNDDTVRYTYDDFGNITSITDQGGLTTTYQRNTLGQTTKLLYADGSFESYTYDAKGNMMSAKNRKGETTLYTYDAFSNLTEAEYADGTSSQYTYDARGNVTKIVENGKTTAVTYNANGDMTQVTYPDGKQVAYTYDEFGRTTSITDSAGVVTNYAYDALGRLSKLTDANDAVQTEYTYNADGSLKKQTNANGTYTVYAFENGQLKSIKNYAANGSELSKFIYSYDMLGYIDSMTENSGTWHYAYDALGQLTRATAPDGTVTQYAYDKSGNRTSVTVGDTVTAYTENNLNQYTAYGSTTLTYDANGNLIGKTDANGATTYRYDCRDRLVKVTAPGSVTEYGYDAFGGRNSVKVDGVDTQYVNTPTGYGDVLTSYSGGSATSYIQGSGLTAQISGGQTYFYNYNHLGSTSEITGADGTAINAYTYDQEGTVTGSTGTLVNPFTYVGKYGIMDDADGLWYMRARYVSKETDSFITVDPIRQNGSVNVYKYADNTLNYVVDLTGKDGVNFNNSIFNNPMNVPTSRTFQRRAAESAANNLSKKAAQKKQVKVFLESF